MTGDHLPFLFVKEGPGLDMTLGDDELDRPVVVVHAVLECSCTKLLTNSLVLVLSQN